FAVQGIYNGWALLGVFTIGASLANLALSYLLRRRRPAFWFAAIAAGCMLAALAVFFIWTYPANVATENWTKIPPEWASLRWQWEYSHAAGAVLIFSALCAVALASLTADAVD